MEAEAEARVLVLKINALAVKCHFLKLNLINMLHTNCVCVNVLNAHVKNVPRLVGIGSDVAIVITDGSRV